MGQKKFVHHKKQKSNLTNQYFCIYSGGEEVYISVTLYTVKEVAKIIQSNTTYVYELIRKGYLPALKLGSYKIRADALEKFLTENEGKDLTNLDDVKELPISKKIRRF